jgi:hypothetical protein
MTMSNNDRGNAALMVMMVAAALATTSAAAVLTVGGHVIDRTRAQTAADAAALGALQSGREAAVALAHRHGATLLSYEMVADVHRVIVVVRVGDSTARAAASDAP